MSYAEELKLFKAAHKYESITVGGSNFHYILSGKKEKQNTGNVKWGNEHLGNVGMHAFFKK